MDSGTLIRNLANVVNLSTPLGLTVAIGARARLRFRDGLIVAERARLPFVAASAVTVGSVVLVPGRDVADLTPTIPGLLEHESEHAWQYALLGGLPFVPLYLLATLWSLLRSGDRAAANCFERQAGLESGGYAARPRLRRAGGGRSGRPGGTPAGAGAA